MTHSMEEPNQARMEQAIGRMARGDRDAMRVLYAECAGAVYAYALSILKNAADAEDVLHDCFLKVWSAAPDYESRGKPMAWIFTIAKNLARSRLRERIRLFPLSDDDSVLPAKESLPDEDRMLLEACLDELSDGEREIVILHAVGGLKHREIASIVKLPLGTVLSKYRRAIGKLRAKLEKEQGIV